MKKPVEKRKANGPLDYFALSLTTFGVGYIPGAPGTYGSAVGVLIYWLISSFATNIHVNSFEIGADLTPFQALGNIAPSLVAWFHVSFAVLFLLFCLLGIWASGRTEAIFGNGDPSQAVVDEVMGQLVTFTFIPFGLGWPWILAGFLLFRFFDIVKPYPANRLQDIPGGLGICADDIVAGVYAGICLAIGYAVYLSV